MAACGKYLKWCEGFQNRCLHHSVIILITSIIKKNLSWPNLKLRPSCQTNSLKSVFSWSSYPATNQLPYNPQTPDYWLYTKMGGDVMMSPIGWKALVLKPRSWFRAQRRHRGLLVHFETKDLWVVAEVSSDWSVSAACQNNSRPPGGKSMTAGC